MDWRYESEDGLSMVVETGQPPVRHVNYRGKRYYPVHPCADPVSARTAVGLGTCGVLVRGATSRGMRCRVFESHQLPRWDPDAPAHNPKNGKPRFNGTHEIEEYLAKKRHKEGLDMRYGEL